MTPLEVLQKVYGYDHFRKGQEEIIQNVLNGKDTLAILPTGGGKSVCFQIPALLKDGICIVVTPLIALMLDQVYQLNRRGIRADALHSGMTSREIDVTLDNCAYGAIHFLYVSPERLKSELFQQRVAKMNVNLIAVDEAHCISQWGHDFRPAYREIAELRKLCPGVPVIALSASATPEVQKDICEQLHFKQGYGVFRETFGRKNLSYAVREEDDKDHKLLEILRKIEGSSIVYTRSRKSTSDIARFLFMNGISCTFYHAGLAAEERQKRQQQWVNGQVTVMVATSAFGMGIDKANVRTVIHYDIPSSMESYYQEAGRAGRDGLKAFAVLICNEQDLGVQKKILDSEHPDKETLQRVYQALANYYSLAIGSLPERSLDFDISAFSERYRIPAMDLFNALKKLEENGLIQLNMGIHLPSRAIFLANKTEVYKFEIAHQRSENFIKGLLRLYGGELYTHYVTIYEQQIAKLLGMSVESVYKELNYLVSAGILDYQQRKDNPQIMFLQPRQDVRVLSVSQHALDSRKDQAFEKWSIMAAYFRNRKMCRTRFIQRYFGEESDKRCGTCDICLARLKGEHAEEEERFRQHILELVDSTPRDVEYILNVLDPEEPEQVIELIRQMVDYQELKYLDNWKIARMDYAG
ncbi:RecQ family ATP-dependent DNA helicase [Fulvivirga sedimenti]|uniref:ATP-dependent DNA helicase RecQ n=1 Tax=Fulvivirga sedimenti TaxID=2879465 RepID=A0A9X1HTD3_9BACT|nr:ATP-dependent DNA helicase RecQ [Fulvivirga sedimenti]MCA6075260.1 RecQ family ATP-dependent DNA helicase [Fulvivirga sedimenti]MCA6076437.1 RecQ family ATP-dependent DNA helicase [Fulvivirga sedimenti]MCA6077565.1 RecQ family ATP-dependent DNA helicase [Fulvivirga sedimenti]